MSIITPPQVSLPILKTALLEVSRFTWKEEMKADESKAKEPPVVLVVVVLVHSKVPIAK